MVLGGRGGGGGGMAAWCPLPRKGVTSFMDDPIRLFKERKIYFERFDFWRPLGPILALLNKFHGYTCANFKFGTDQNQRPYN